jgi:hypothetical protein
LKAENDEASNVWASIARDLRCNDTFGQSLRQVALLAFTPNHHDWQHVGNHPLAGVTSFVSRLQRKLFWWRVKRTDARNS